MCAQDQDQVSEDNSQQRLRQRYTINGKLAARAEIALIKAERSATALNHIKIQSKTRITTEIQQHYNKTTSVRTLAQRIRENQTECKVGTCNKLGEYRKSWPQQRLLLPLLLLCCCCCCIHSPTLSCCCIECSPQIDMRSLHLCCCDLNTTYCCCVCCCCFISHLIATALIALLVLKPKRGFKFT